ncbi:MAG: HAMP domain-containing sensor histidine kinase [Hyphomicrobiales bacterium]
MMLRLAKTSTFRLTSFYMAAFALSVSLILLYIYVNTVVLFERQVEAGIDAEVASLVESYDQGGLAGLVETIRRRGGYSSDNFYLLTDFFGHRIAGNLNGLPVKALGRRGWLEFPYLVATANGFDRRQIRAFRIPLDRGFSLLVGRDVQTRRDFGHLIKRTQFSAIVLVIVFGLGGGLLMSRNFLKRINTISRTIHRIMAGDLSGRVPVGGSGGELDRLAGDLNRMLARIERLMTGMKEISSNIAHDLKTPLTRLRARVETALGKGDSATWRKALKHTLEEADRILHIFDALLLIDRAQFGGLKDNVCDIDVGVLVNELRDLFAPLVEDAGGALNCRVERGLGLRANRQLLAQALTNLLDNALKYGVASSCPPVIEIAAHRHNDTVVISVADRGPGIAASQREHVLKRFVRLTPGRSKPGNGLGLSLVKAVAACHGGSLRLIDNNPGLRVELVLALNKIGR